ncbi:hypothetical protein P9112_001325 [Eukaryota sp. TZLM1-RC]
MALQAKTSYTRTRLVQSRTSSKQIFGQSRLSTAPPRTTFSSDASTAPVVGSYKLPLRIRWKLSPITTFGCSTCAFIIGALEAKLDDDATREEIREALMHVCKNEQLSDAL